MGPPPPIFFNPLFIFGVMALLFVPLEKRFGAWPWVGVLRPGWQSDVAFFFMAWGLLLVEVTWWVKLLHGWLLPLGVPGVQQAVASLPVGAAMVLAYLSATFFDYWAHRALHTKWFWPLHAVHHSSPRVDWLAATRVHPLELVLLRTSQLAPLIWLGFPLQAVTVVPFGWFLLGDFTHSNLRLNWGPLKWVLVTPEYHHWHHSTDLRQRDTNFGGFITLWDWVFRTMTRPTGGQPAATGTTVAIPMDFLRAIAFSFWPGKKYRLAVEQNRRDMEAEKIV